MQKNTILVLAIVLCTPQVGYAHDVASDQYAHEELIADLNAIAAIFSPDDITNHTVISVSSVTCATMRTAIREQFAQRIGPVLRERYPSPEDIENLSLTAFIAFEQETLANFGATKEAQELVGWSIDENPFIPPNPPAEDGALVDNMAAIEDISCELRAAQLGGLTELAPPEAASVTRALVNGVIGVGVIVFNAKVTVETGGLAAAVFGIASGGWGWNRVEEATSEALEIWQAWFR